ncbi:MAG TPA: VOC family protein [Chitinophagaceae bacterium]|nr:VOC family protein [Chitinophagaceae bacterium]
MQKITPFLWFNNQAEEAAKFYCSVFKNSKILSVHPLVVSFELEGQKFMALNGGPQFKFTEAISFLVDCETQQEVDYYWDKLISGGGQESMCGWLKDKFGMSWQIVPSIVGKLMSDPDPARSQRVMQALLQMKKLDIATLQKAYDEK